MGKQGINLPWRSTSHWARIAQLIPLNLFWNGIVGWVYVAMLSSLFEGGVIVILPLLFLTPFIGAGIRHFFIPLVLELATVSGLLRLSLDYDIQKNGVPPLVPPMSFCGGVVQLGVAGWLIISGMIPAARVWMDMRNWEPTQCEILSSEVHEMWELEPPKYDMSVKYRYLFEGREYVGERYSMYGTPRARPSSIEKKIQEYPAGSVATCYVNPADPGQAVLSRDIRGLRFARGGLGGILWLGGALAFGIGMRNWVRNFPERNLRRPERIVFWALLLVGWSVFGSGLILGDICQRVEEGKAASPGTGILVFFGAVGLIMLSRLLYHIFVKWDRVAVLSPREFFTMYKRAKKGRRTDDESLS